MASQTLNPASGDGRTATFHLPAGAFLFGGFPAGGGDFESRDPAAHATVLSGDLEGDDTIGDPATSDDNAYHVVTVDALGAPPAQL